MMFSSCIVACNVGRAVLLRHPFVRKDIRAVKPIRDGHRQAFRMKSPCSVTFRMSGKRFCGIVSYIQDKYNRARHAIRVFDTQDFRSKLPLHLPFQHHLTALSYNSEVHVI